MSEQRFTLDDESRYIMEYGMPMTIFDVIMMLNEQQDTIQSLKEENRKLKKKRLRKCTNNWKQEIVERGKLEEENEMLRQKLDF